MDCWDPGPSPAWTHPEPGAVCVIQIRTWPGAAASAGLYCPAHPSLHKPARTSSSSSAHSRDRPKPRQGVCACVQCPMATPPRGRLSPVEPRGTGMAQLQFWAPEKEAQGSVYSWQCLGQWSLCSFKSRFAVMFEERDCVCSTGQEVLGSAPGTTAPGVRLDHVSNVQVP